MDFHSGLIVRSRREDFRFPRRNCRIAFDQFCVDPAKRLDAERQRRHVQQQDIFDIAFEHPALNGGADGHDFIGVDTLMRWLVDERLGRLHDPRHARHPADQHQFINIAGVDPGVFQARLDWPDGALEEIVAKLFHLRPRQFHANMLWPAGVGGDKGQVNLINLRAGKGDFGLFRLFFDPLQSIGLFAQVHALLLFEFIENPIHDP